jgi:membrane protease YdiL (CAAX protease family)
LSGRWSPPPCTASAPANLVLCAIYALIIRWMTPAVPPQLELRRPWIELGIWFTLLLVFLVIQLSENGLLGIPWLSQAWDRFMFGIIRGNIIQLEQAGAPYEIAQDLFLAASSTLKHTIPLVVLTLALGYGWRGLGLAPRAGRLTLILLTIAVALGLPFGVLTMAPPWQLALGYLIGLFINALPEELLYRGYLLPRLEAVLRSPLTALVISVWLFNLGHVPLAIAQRGESPWVALADVFAITEPTGLIWGYLYLRTRSVLPGTLWHGTNAVLGIVFFMPSG